MQPYSRPCRARSWHETPALFVYHLDLTSAGDFLKGLIPVSTLIKSGCSSRGIYRIPRDPLIFFQNLSCDHGFLIAFRASLRPSYGQTNPVSYYFRVGITILQPACILLGRSWPPHRRILSSALSHPRSNRLCRRSDQPPRYLGSRALGR